jgi:hypothetical protein
MNKTFKALLASALILTMVGCTRIETGEVGVRIDFDKTVQPAERLPGTLNQTIWGDVLTFQTKDVAVEVENLTPLAADNSTVQDFDLTLIYSINPQQVAELYVDKNRSFHSVSADGDTLLMYNYVVQLGRNAAYKAARGYESLKLADNRVAIEQAILASVTEALSEEGLGSSITVEQALIRRITPAASITESANNLVRAQNELKQKEVEVETAKAEARRIEALNANAGAVDYMAATALVNISEAVKEGKVNTIVIPYDFEGIVNVGNTPAPRN